MKKTNQLSKKLLLVMIALALLVLSGCESKAEKDYRRASEAAKEAHRVYEDSISRYEDTNRRLDEIQRLEDILNNAD